MKVYTYNDLKNENNNHMSIFDESLFFKNEDNKNNLINVTLEDINNLNIIINDDNCRDVFINSVCEQLDKDGIKFKYTKNCENIDCDNSVILTLDQQYMAGPASLIFCPLENGRSGNSDALALSTEIAFKNNGVLVDGILCGQLGFEEKEDGSISQRTPTQTEITISKMTNSSFITISLGTQSIDPELVESCIKNALIRYCSYISNKINDADLVYRVEENDSISTIAEKLTVDEELLKNYNNHSNDDLLLAGQTIINPIVADIKEFNVDTFTDICIDKTTRVK